MNRQKFAFLALDSTSHNSTLAPHDSPIQCDEIGGFEDNLGENNHENMQPKRMLNYVAVTLKNVQAQSDEDRLFLFHTCTKQFLITLLSQTCYTF